MLEMQVSARVFFVSFNEYGQLINHNVLLISVLVDTRLWYHGTHVSKGDFSLTVQSEYG